MPRPSPALVAAMLYLALVGSCAYMVHRRDAPAWKVPPSADWVAARDLPALDQLDSADLARPPKAAGKALPARASLVGRHLVSKHEKGDTITPADVGPLAMGSPGPGRVRFVLAARAGEAPALALSAHGDKLTPCLAAGKPPAWNCSAAPFTLLVVHRPTTAADSLWAIMETSSAEQAAAFLAAPTRILVRR